MEVCGSSGYGGATGVTGTAASASGKPLRRSVGDKAAELSTNARMKKATEVALVVAEVMREEASDTPSSNEAARRGSSKIIAGESAGRKS